MRKMSGTVIRYARQLFVIAPLIGTCLGILGACRPSLEEKNNSARDTVVEWCRLAELPASRTNEAIVVTGSSFTRGFEVSFTLNPHELALWTGSGPGLQDASLETKGDTMTYLVKPKDAQYCLVQINTVTGEVYIETYWS